MSWPLYPLSSSPFAGLKWFVCGFWGSMISAFGTHTLLLERTLNASLIQNLEGVWNLARCDHFLSPRPLRITITESLKVERERGRESAMAETVKHIVLLKFKDDVSPQQVDDLIKGFQALPASINCIKGFEWGTDVSVENRHQGFTHVFILTFDSPQERDAYLVHPAHEAYATEVLKAAEKALVVDFKPSALKCS